MTPKRLEELRQLAGAADGSKSAWMDELITEVERLEKDRAWGWSKGAKAENELEDVKLQVERLRGAARKVSDIYLDRLTPGWKPGDLRDAVAEMASLLSNEKCGSIKPTSKQGGFICDLPRGHSGDHSGQGPFGRESWVDEANDSRTCVCPKEDLHKIAPDCPRHGLPSMNK